MLSTYRQLSVLLSLYKGEQPTHLEQALNSIWDAQTIKPSQIVLVQDGPLTESLKSVIESWKEQIGSTLTIVPLEQNVGLAAALNIGLQYCEHELVARMDTDDIALPNRFELQVPFMLANENIVASSGQIEEWDEHLVKKLNIRSLPTDSVMLAKFAKRRSPLSHPATIFRKSVIESVGGYPRLERAQDYGLWALLLHHGYRLANLPDTLLKMRTGAGLLSRRGLKYYRYEYQLLSYQKEIGFLNTSEFLVNLGIRGFARMPFIQKLVYQFGR